MKVELNKQFFEPDGKVIQLEDGKEFLLKEVISRALMMDFKDEQEMSGEDKVKRYHLGMRVYGSAESVELTVEELSLIKKQIAKLFGIAVCAQAWDMLEGK